VPRWIEDLYFSVKLHTDARLEEVVARCSGIPMPRTAFEAARKQYPTRLVMLCR
jgi:hypothetical protein